MTASKLQAHHLPASLHDARVGDWMTLDPVSIPPDASIHEAVVLMSELRISALPVVDSETRALVGVVSQTDIVRHERERGPQAVAQVAPDDRVGEGFQVVDASAEQVAIETIMTPTVVHVASTASIVDALDLLADASIHRVFVLDKAQQLVGVLSSSDVVRRLVAAFRADAIVGAPYPEPNPNA